MSWAIKSWCTKFQYSIDLYLIHNISCFKSNWFNLNLNILNLDWLQEIIIILLFLKTSHMHIWHTRPKDCLGKFFVDVDSEPSQKTILVLLSQEDHKQIISVSTNIQLHMFRFKEGPNKACTCSDIKDQSSHTDFFYLQKIMWGFILLARYFNFISNTSCLNTMISKDVFQSI